VESPLPKRVRFAEFLRRLGAAPGAASFEAAYAELCRLLNAVEDELTTIPFAPERWQTDGRLYPPQPDSMRDMAGWPQVVRFRSRRHNTFIGANGSIEIRAASHDWRDGEVLFTRPGADGKGVWDQ
jgi:hypothetical protein